MLGPSVELIWAGCNESAAGEGDGANGNLLLLWRKLIPRGTAASVAAKTVWCDEVRPGFPAGSTSAWLFLLKLFSVTTRGIKRLLEIKREGKKSQSSVFSCREPVSKVQCCR